MPIRRFIFLILLPSLAVNSIFCQKIFREGYVIRKNGEILDGTIEYRLKQSVPSTCVFKWFEIALEMTFRADEIKEFGYYNGNRYVSKPLNGKDTFIEVLVSGEITLYRLGSRFFLDKGQSDLIDLNANSIEFLTYSKIQTFNGIISFLKFITEGKVAIKEEKLNLNKDLIPIIAEYNKVSGNQFVVYKQDFSEEKLLNESFRSGLNLNRFGLVAGLNIYSLKIIGASSTFHVLDPVPEIAPIIGLKYERIISRTNDRLSLRADLLFLKQDFYTYEEYDISTSKYRVDTYFDFTGIKLPLMIQYSLTSNRIVPYIQTGISYMALIQRGYLHIKEIESSDHSISTIEDSDATFYPGEISGLCGAGLKIRIVGNINLNIQGRIEIGQGLFNKESLYNSTLSTKKLKQYSIQPSFVVGITL